MDVLYFLKERTEFIRRYYDTASEPFQETLRKIEVGVFGWRLSYRFMVVAADCLCVARTII